MIFLSTQFAYSKQSRVHFAGFLWYLSVSPLTPEKLFSPTLILPNFFLVILDTLRQVNQLRNNFLRFFHRLVNFVFKIDLSVALFIPRETHTV